MILINSSKVQNNKNTNGLLEEIKSQTPIELNLETDYWNGQEQSYYDDQMSIDVGNYTIDFHLFYTETFKKTSGSYDQCPERNTLWENCEVSDISVWKEGEEVKVPKSLLLEIEKQLIELIN